MRVKTGDCAARAQAFAGPRVPVTLVIGVAREADPPGQARVREPER